MGKKRQLAEIFVVVMASYSRHVIFKTYHHIILIPGFPCTIVLIILVCPFCLQYVRTSREQGSYLIFCSLKIFVTLSLYRMRFFGLCSSLLLLATLSMGQQEAGGALGRDTQQQQHLRPQQQQYLPQQKQQNQQFPYNLFQNRQATVG